MAIKELITKFGFEVDDEGLKELQEGIDSIKEGLLHLGELLIGEAVGLFELVEKASEAGVQLKLMTQQTGLTAEKLQELQFRAKLADVSTEELNQSMTFLSRNMNEAAMGSEEARKHFRQFGISAEELRSGSLKADDVLKRMSATFDKMPDGPRKTGLALEIFGRSGARMVPFLNGLRKELDPINEEIMKMSMVTDEQIEQSEEFHVTLETLKTAFMGIARVVGFGLMPIATKVIETMKKWVVQNRAMIVQNLTGFVKGMAAALSLTIKIVDALVQSLSGLAAGFGGVEMATKLLLGTLAVMSGASVLFGIGKVIQAVMSLAESFAVADMAAAAIPIAIGAAIVAILLIMEDIYSFFSGKKSFTGDLLEKIPEVGKVFKEVFGAIFEPFVNIVTMITSGFGSWTDIFKELGVLIINALLLPLRAVSSIVGNMAGVIGRITGSDTLKAYAESAEKFTDGLKLDSVVTGPNAGQNPDQRLPTSSINLKKHPEMDAMIGMDTVDSIGPQAATGVGGGKQINNNNKVALTQTFTFPPGTDPKTVAPSIADKVTGGLDDLLRGANRATSNGGAY